MVLLLSKLDQHRFKSTVCAITPDISLANDLESLGIKVLSLNARSRYDPRIPLHLLRVLRSEKPDILHTYLFHSNVLGRLVGRLSRVPTILNSERAIDQDGAHRIALNRLTSCLATQIETKDQRKRLGSLAVRTLRDADEVAIIERAIPSPSLGILRG